MSPTTFSVAMFGAGRIGNVHARNIHDHPQSRLAYVVDPVQGPATALAARYGARYVGEAEALADPAVDAIVVASATSTHA
ncbi:MAG: hypothetical protein RJA49_2342, partial [Actinomycetota bacterium]